MSACLEVRKQLMSRWRLSSAESSISSISTTSCMRSFTPRRQARSTQQTLMTPDGSDASSISNAAARRLRPLPHRRNLRVRPQSALPDQ